VNVLGEGRANGAISILHALGLGRGCSVGIQLETEVKIVDELLEVENDRHGLLEAIESCWREDGLPIPEEFGWKIESTVPIGQGLKSSSALSCAALRALNSCSWAGLSNSEIADLAAKAQLMSGCAKTGSMDDNWASLEYGWKLVDPSLTASDSVIIQGLLDDSLSVLVCLRGPRSVEVSPHKFSEQRQIFERSLASVMSGNILGALSSNGMAVSAATDDHEALRLSNLCIASGAISSGVSGSGPAIAIVCFEDDSDDISRIISEMGLLLISTSFVSSEELLEEAS
jgi:shikimate kinase